MSRAWTALGVVATCGNVVVMVCAAHLGAEVSFIVASQGALSACLGTATGP